MLQNVSMYGHIRGIVPRLLILAVSFVCTPAAHAALGGDAASIAADAAQLRGVEQQSMGPSFGMVAITTDNGILVHEFVDDSGLVFAVNWSGPAVPDLRGLLGSYFASYASVLSGLPNPGRQRAIHAITADLVVVCGGHLRAYTGLAYLPARVPAGVAPETLSRAHE
jgi:hypothetical protein